MIDKNQAIIDYLLTCPQIQNSSLYFNFIHANDNDKQIVTTSNDSYSSRPYIDGSVARRYTFTIIDFKSVSDSAIVNLDGYINENVEEMADVQKLIDWVKEQDALHNYPNFGEDCIIQQIQPTADNPTLDGINTDVQPMLAMYSVSIQVDYIDMTKAIWK